MSENKDEPRQFAGASAWLITDGAAGGVAQLKGVAQALGAEATLKQVAPRWPWRVMAPWGPVSQLERFGRDGSQFAPPWPQLAIATARQTIPYIRALKRASGGATYTVVLQDPRTRPSVADLIAAPKHDRIEGENVIKTLTSPNPYSPTSLEALRREPYPGIDALPEPRVAISIGGPNAVYRYSPDSCARFASSIRKLARSGASFLVTTSRRTTGDLSSGVLDAVRDRPHIFWDGAGENPYPHFLARADAIVVTADSVNMTSDACATGRPVYVFMPEGGSQKFDRFHEALRDYGAIRELLETSSAFENWTYEPLDAAAQIAREIERRAAERVTSAAATD